MSTFEAPGGTQHCDDSSLTFNKLPQELQDLVYHELWKDEARLQVARGRVNRGSYEVHYGKHAATKPLCYGLPQWLLTSKMFLHDGICQLIAKGSWVSHWYPRTQMQGSLSQLIDLRHVTNLTFVAHMVGSPRSRHDPPFEQSKKIEFRLSSITPHGDDPLVCYLCPDVSPNLKNVVLVARHDLAGKRMRSRDVYEWVVDLLELQCTRVKLDSITVRSNLWWKNSLESFGEGLRGAYEREVTLLGKAIVGDEGCLESEQAVYRVEEGPGLVHKRVHHYDFVTRFCKRGLGNHSLQLQSRDERVDQYWKRQLP